MEDRNDEKLEKSLKKNSFIMDINIIEAPFFLFNQKIKALRAQDLLKRDDLAKNVREVVELFSNDTEVKYHQWQDSKGLQRELLAVSSMQLPRGFTMDVWYGLVGLYIKKTSPVAFDINTRTYDMKDDTLYFTLYELATFMGVSTGGKMIKKIKDSIRELKSTEYFSFANGMIYNKSKESYIKSKERGISLIIDYAFQAEKRTKSKEKYEKNSVRFNPLIVDNIKYEYIKYLNTHIYFSLPSGLTRALYSYIEGNKYDCNGRKLIYIKRSYDVIANKIPIEYRYYSDLRNKIKKPLQNLIEAGILKDYLYGDVEKIDGKKEYCIYFIFKGGKDDLIEIIKNKKQIYDSEDDLLLSNKGENSIEVENAQSNYNKVESENKPKEDKNKFELEVPQNMESCLLEMKVSENEAKRWIKEYDEWIILKYYLWVQHQLFEGRTIENPAGLLSIALSTSLPMIDKYKFIDEFIEKKKNELLMAQESVDERYEKYVQEEVEKFKGENQGMYMILSESWLEQIKQQYGKLYDSEMLNDTDMKMYEEFLQKKNDSKLFKKVANANIKIMKNIMTLDDFKFNQL